MISTNIAETSITIEDCVFVVEVGKMKEKWFDPNKNMESLGMRSRRIHFCFKMFHKTNKKLFISLIKIVLRILTPKFRSCRLKKFCNLVSEPKNWQTKKIEIFILKPVMKVKQPTIEV